MEYDELVYACAISRICNYDCLGAKDIAGRRPFPSEIFSLSKSELAEIFGNKSRYVDDFQNEDFLIRSEQEVKWAAEHGIRIFYIGDPDYPHRLKACDDAPVVLFYRGSADLNARHIISIVGTRKMTPYGNGICEKIVKELSHLDEPPLIISGLAFGVDICAHKSAIKNQLDTVGVMATGLDKIYPYSHREFAVEMVGHGGILSEYFSNTTPKALNFIRRNRIIAGLSDATLLIESGQDGGGVITSNMAFSYSREVFAVPGRITDELSTGCNDLIKNNIATCVNRVDMIGREMRWKKTTNNVDDTANLFNFECDSPIKRKIFAALSTGGLLDIDEICKKAACTLREATLNLTELEIEGKIESDFSGKFFIK